MNQKEDQLISKKKNQRKFFAGKPVNFQKNQSIKKINWSLKKEFYLQRKIVDLQIQNTNPPIY